MESVDCQECGFRYDSDENAFCPRCGSVSTAPEPVATMASVQRADPLRRRVQVGGVILLVLGLLSVVLYSTVALTAATLVPEFAQELLADQPGGTIEVTVVDAGTPVVGANVTLTAQDGSRVANGTTDAAGTVAFTAEEHAAVNVTVQVGDQVFDRRALALQGSSVAVHIDVAQDEPSDDAWIGVRPLVRTMQVMLGFFIFMAAFVAFAGVCALRLRYRNIAIAGAVVGALPMLIVAVAVQNVGTLLLLGMMVLALAFIVSGRRHFA